MKKIAKKILVIVAHPDDEVLGCGGTIAKHISAGEELNVMVLADGVTSRYYEPKVSLDKEGKKYKRLIDIRLDEFYTAAALLGVKKSQCYYLGLPDQRLDAFPLLDVVKKIEALAEKLVPEVIYTHHWGDLNKDHRICYEATMTAFRPSKKANENRSIYCFEINGNMDYLSPLAANTFRPDQFNDVSGFIHKKISALTAYKSEHLIYPSPLSPQQIINLSIRRAKNKPYKHAESFERAK
ncbi:MAG: PIG-L family deacetylase [Candidatus Margulisiibacteriota bacterium]